MKMCTLYLYTFGAGHEQPRGCSAGGRTGLFQSMHRTSCGHTWLSVHTGLGKTCSNFSLDTLSTSTSLCSIPTTTIQTIKDVFGDRNFDNSMLKDIIFTLGAELLSTTWPLAQKGQQSGEQ